MVSREIILGPPRGSLATILAPGWRQNARYLKYDSDSQQTVEKDRYQQQMGWREKMSTAAEQHTAATSSKEHQVAANSSK